MAHENTIKRYFAVSDWIKYSEVEQIGSVGGMTKEQISTVMGGRNTLVTSWLDDNGNGYEERKTYMAPEEM